MNGWLLEIETPRGNWCQDLRSLFPDHQFRVHMMVPTSAARCMESVAITGPAVNRVLAALQDHPHVATVIETGRSNRMLQVRLILKGCPVADVTRTSGLAPRLPFVIVPDRDVWLVLGQEEALRDAQARLDAENVRTRAIRKGHWAGPHSSLTEHQRSVLTAAVQAGYYEYPRKTTLTDLAADLSVAKSTLSQTLMVVEMKLVNNFLENPEGVEPTVSADPGGPPSSDEDPRGRGGSGGRDHDRTPTRAHPADRRYGA